MYEIRPCGAFTHSMPCDRTTASTPKCKENKCNNDWYAAKTEKRTYKSELIIVMVILSIIEKILIINYSTKILVLCFAKINIRQNLIKPYGGSCSRKGRVLLYSFIIFNSEVKHT